MAGGIVLFTNEGGGSGFLSTHAKATLTDNSGPTILIAVNKTTYQGLTLFYSMKRGTNYRIGWVTVLSDGTLALGPSETIESEIGDCGITWTSSVASGNVNLLYTASSTGTNAKIEYDLYQMTIPT